MLTNRGLNPILGSDCSEERNVWNYFEEFWLIRLKEWKMHVQTAASSGPSETAHAPKSYLDLKKPKTKQKSGPI